MKMKRSTFLGMSLRAYTTISCLLILCLAMLLLHSGDSAASAQVAQKPNIVFILTDDSDYHLLSKMPNIRTELIQKGVTLHNAFVPFPTCCPGRSTVLRGQYPHNHGVIHNYPPEGGLKAFRENGLEDDTLATRLHDAGYRTGLFGKYMNGYGSVVDPYKPPGWDSWRAWVDGYRSGELYEDGETVTYNPSERHETDILGTKAATFIRNASEGEKPFFAYIAFNTPHDPSYTEDQYRGAGNGIDYSPSFNENRGVSNRIDYSPSFNEEDVSDKPRWVRQFPRLDAETVASYHAKEQQRLEAMRSVDEEVDHLLNVLREAGELNNTYFVLWNDNGYHVGEHRIPRGKRTAYEENVRYPLIIRGPGVHQDVAPPHMVVGTDLMPTFLDMAAVQSPSYVDGRSLMPLLKSTPPPLSDWRSAVLLEGWRFNMERKEYDPPDYKGIRTLKRKYIEYKSGDRELYNLEHDPYELTNYYDDAAPPVGLVSRLQGLKSCSEDSCRAAEGP